MPNDKEKILISRKKKMKIRAEVPRGKRFRESGSRSKNGKKNYFLFFHIRYETLIFKIVEKGYFEYFSI